MRARATCDPERWTLRACAGELIPFTCSITDVFTILRFTARGRETPNEGVSESVRGGDVESEQWTQQQTLLGSVAVRRSRARRERWRTRSLDLGDSSYNCPHVPRSKTRRVKKDTMAIPFLPHESTEDEQLMYQLYVQLHNALRSRNAHHPSRNRELSDFLRKIYRKCESHLKRIIANRSCMRVNRPNRAVRRNSEE